jgi:hypothetical protein
MVAEPRPLAWQRAIRNVLLFWMMAWYGFVYFSDRRRNGRVNVSAYEQGLIKLLAVIRKELAGQPFSAAARVTARSRARWRKAPGSKAGTGRRVVPARADYETR